MDPTGLTVCLSILGVGWWLGCLIGMVLILGGLSWVLTEVVDRRDIPLWLALRGYPDTSEGGLPLGETIRGSGHVVHLSEDMRHTHQLLLGASGSGKSKALAGWAAHDLRTGHGVILIDPHEGLVHDVLTLADGKTKPPIILSAGDPDWAIGYNPLQTRAGMSHYQVAAALLDVFQKVWSDDWGVWMHDYLLHSFWALSATGWTMLEVPQFLVDPTFRENIARELKLCSGDLGPLLDWIAEYDAKTPGQQKVERQSTLVRIRQFVSDPNIRVIIGQRQSTVSFERIIGEQIPFLVCLTWRELKVNAYLLGALLLSQLQDAVLSGPTIDQHPRPVTYFYVDEFQEMATHNFVEVLAQARKYGLSVVVSTQTLEPLGAELEAAVMANCRNLCVFTCSHADATKLAYEIFVDTERQPIGMSNMGHVGSSSVFEPNQREYIEHIQGQYPRQFWMRRKGQSKALQLRTQLVNLPRNSDDRIQAILEDAGRTYGKPRKEVELELASRRTKVKAPHKRVTESPDDPDALETLK